METTGTNAGTSNTDWTISSWNKDYSIFPALSSPFCIRSGGIWSNAGAGKFALSRSMGNNHYDNGFRAVIIGI